MGRKSTDFTIVGCRRLSGDPGKFLLVEERRIGSGRVLRVSELTATESVYIRPKRGTYLGDLEQAVKNGSVGVAA